MCRTPDGRSRRFCPPAVVEHFVAASQAKVQKLGYQGIFKKYDDDGSGELDAAEFINAVRTECKLSTDAVSDDELEELFCMIDSDGSSAIDADEFYEMLTHEDDEPEMTYEAFKRSMFELADVWAEEVSEDSYCAFLGTVFEAIACPTGLMGLDEIGSLIGADGRALVRLRAVDDVEVLIGSDGQFREDVRRGMRGRRGNVCIFMPDSGEGGQQKKE
eukprot:SAG22_NODE_4380_length_1287_cov_1.029461_1_plen_216_part_10